MKRANGDGSITVRERNGKKYYTATFTVGFKPDGTQIRKSKSSNKQGHVVEWLNEMKAKQKQLSIHSDDITLEGFTNYWLFNVKAPTIKPNSLERYESTIRTHLATSNLWKKKLTKIKFEHVEELFAEYARIDPKTQEPMLSINTRKYLLRVMRSIFKHAILLQKIQVDPTMTITLPKNDNKQKPTFTQKEQQKIINSLTSSVEDRAILLALATGLRQSELLGLQWKDLKDGMLSVTKQYNYVTTVSPDGTRTNTLEITPLKTTSSQGIMPVPSNVARYFENFREDDEKFLFEENGKIIDRKKLRRRLTKILTDNNIPHKTFHQLRHAYATRLFETGVDLKTVSGLMRHSDISTTANIYTHLTDDKKQNATKQIAQFLVPELTIAKTKSS